MSDENKKKKSIIRSVVLVSLAITVCSLSYVVYRFDVIWVWYAIVLHDTKGQQSKAFTWGNGDFILHDIRPEDAEDVLSEKKARRDYKARQDYIKASDDDGSASFIVAPSADNPFAETDETK